MNNKINLMLGAAAMITTMYSNVVPVNSYLPHKVIDTNKQEESLNKELQKLTALLKEEVNDATKVRSINKKKNVITN